MSRCDCELLLHYADCPYDGPDYTAARFDALEAEVAALTPIVDAARALRKAYEEECALWDSDDWSADRQTAVHAAREDAEQALWRALDEPGDRRGEGEE